MIGILNMYPLQEDAKHIYNALQLMNLEYKSINPYIDKNWFFTIENSHIKKWICTGSNRNVFDKDAIQLKQLPKHKEYFLICFSMQSFLVYHLNESIYHFSKRYYCYETLNDKLIWRNHQWGFLKQNFTLIKNIEYSKDVLMKCIFTDVKNDIFVTMTQYHPERTVDGLKELKLFLN